MKEGGRRARDGDVTMYAMLGAMQRRAHEPRNVGHLKKLKKKTKETDPPQSLQKEPALLTHFGYF